MGLTGVLLGLHLGRLGFSAPATGLVIGAGLAGNAAATAALTWWPERFPPGPTLLGTTVLAALGLAAAGLLDTPLPYALAAFVGLLNGMGRDRGPAQVVEQSLLADLLPADQRPGAMARYTATQDILGGLGSLTAGLPDLLGGDPRAATRLVFLAAAILALGAIPPYLAVLRQAGRGTPGTSERVPVAAATRRKVRDLAALFALDSLGGGFLAGSIVSYWFFHRFGLGGEVLGPLFLAARVLNAGSYFGAELLARRIGLIRTMVFTHLPSSALLLLLPVTGSPAAAIALFLAREALVQMDVPARQAFVAVVTPPGERVYAFGITGLVRNIGWATGPSLAGWSVAAFGLGAPLVLGAGLKVVYDLMLYRSWQAVPETAA